MKWLTLEKIKQQCRIEPDFHDEDTELEKYGVSAEQQVLNDIGRSYSELIAWKGEVPENLIHASLMLVDQSYRQRSTADTMSWSPVPYAYDQLIKPYTRLASQEFDNIYEGAITIGSDAKILVSAELPDGLKMEDVNFTVNVYNDDDPTKNHTYPKAECLYTIDGDYIVLPDTTELGVGRYMLKVTFEIPDTDYPSGYRREILRIDPNVRVIG